MNDVDFLPTIFSKKTVTKKIGNGTIGLVGEIFRDSNNAGVGADGDFFGVDGDIVDVGEIGWWFIKGFLGVDRIVGKNFKPADAWSYGEVK